VRFPERTDANVAAASTSVPPPVASAEMVAQSATARCYGSVASEGPCLRPDLDDLVFVILSEVKRRADPYRDLDVIDSRAPRFNQATIGVLAAVAVATGWWWLLGVLAAQLVVGLTLGRRFCLPCLAYFELVQPRFGEGTLEDARPPRFANLVGAVFLTSATVAYAAGLTTLGAVLGGIVAALALLAATTGFCTGCEAYKLGSFLLGRPFVSCPLPPRAE
jgi:hypothetical protein